MASASEKTRAELQADPSAALILLGEDELDDAFLIRRALARAGLHNPIEHVRDGQEVVRYLQRTLEDASLRRPGLVLLDLKMPLKNGFEVVEWVRAQPAFKNLPVAILTSSQELTDIGRAKALGVTTFLTKSASFVGVAELVRAVALV